MSEDKQSFFVESPDGRKFKMVIRGDLGRLSVTKIRRYLGNYGVSGDCQLVCKGSVLSDEMVGQQFGLENNGVIYIAATEEKPQPAEPTETPSSKPVQRPESSAGRSAVPLRSQNAWSGERDAGVPPASGSEVAELRARLARVEEENMDLHRQLEHASQSAAEKPTVVRSPAAAFDAAKENLRLLADDLRLPLAFDTNCTCVINGEDVKRNGDLSIFVSYDAQTQRVVVYTTLLTQLPVENPPLLAKLYEVLLEGSLLGREVCGGGIGLAKDNGLVVLQTSFSVLHCDTTLLRDVMPVFVETVQRWRALLSELPI